jgi:hypothetical protein
MLLQSPKVLSEANKPARRENGEHDAQHGFVSKNFHKGLGRRTSQPHVRSRQSTYATKKGILLCGIQSWWKLKNPVPFTTQKKKKASWVTILSQLCHNASRNINENFGGNEFTKCCQLQQDTSKPFFDTLEEVPKKYLFPPGWIFKANGKKLKWKQGNRVSKTLNARTQLTTNFKPQTLVKNSCRSGVRWH